MKDQRRKVTVSMAIDDLVHIASHGDMGSGELGTLMQHWAMRECERAGLMRELSDAQTAKLRSLKTNIANVLGIDTVRKIELQIKKVADNMDKILDEKKEDSNG